MKIKLEKLVKKFENQTVLKEINFEDEFTTLAIIGPSGGGKSTLLRMMAGLILPTSGNIIINDDELSKVEKELQNYRKDIGFVFQQDGLFKHLTAIENITLPLIQVHHFDKESANKRAEELLERLGLKEHGQKKPFQLSGGQRQRIAIARAIAAKPKYLLLDEPTSALDPEYTAEILKVIDELKSEGLQFIIVTHEMGFARHACEKVAFLTQGTLLEYGKSEELFLNPKTSELKSFLGRLLQYNV